MSNESYESYEDFYDNGPGSENFKRKLARHAKTNEDNRKKHPTSHPLCTMCPVLEEQVDGLEKKIERLKKQNVKLKKENTRLEDELHDIIQETD